MLTMKELEMGRVGVRIEGGVGGGGCFEGEGGGGGGGGGEGGGGPGQELTGQNAKERQLVAAGRAGWPVPRPAGDSYFWIGSSHSTLYDKQETKIIAIKEIG